MELDLSRSRWLLLALAVLLLLGGLGWLGYEITPAGDKLLTREEWQVLKARRVYREELQSLQKAVGTLSALLAARPDPVRAQITAESIQRLTGEGQPALQYQREKLALAAQAVSSWAVGATTPELAHLALEDAIRALALEPSMTSTPVPTPNSLKEDMR